MTPAVKPDTWRAYEEGFKARLRGAEATSNPYRVASEKWFEWADGWKDQDLTLGHRR